MRYRVKTWKPGAGVSLMLLDAPDVATAGRQASALGYAVLDVAPAAVLPGSGRQSRFPLLLFSQELLALLDSGISVVEAIETLSEKEKRPLIRSALVRILAALREGRPLSAALEAIPEAFPPLYVATVRASERTSDLSEALTRYIAYQSQIETLRGRLVSAAVYPALLLVVGALVIVFLMGFVVPRFAHIYEDLHGDLPVLSRLLLYWGTLVEHYWPLLLGLTAAAVAAGVHLARQPAARRWLSQQAWRLPGLGERLRLIQLARCYRTLGMLLRGGIAIVPALDMVSGLLMPELRERLALAARSIGEGAPISAAFDAHGLTTPVTLRLLRVGERTGNMGEMLERSAAFHDEETGRWAEMATRLLGPLLMLLMGLVIGGVVVLMYLPIFQLAESIR